MPFSPFVVSILTSYRTMPSRNLRNAYGKIKVCGNDIINSDILLTVHLSIILVIN